MHWRIQATGASDEEITFSSILNDHDSVNRGILSVRFGARSRADEMAEEAGSDRGR